MATSVPLTRRKPSSNVHVPPTRCGFAPLVSHAVQSVVEGPLHARQLPWHGWQRPPFAYVPVGHVAMHVLSSARMGTVGGQLEQLEAELPTHSAHPASQAWHMRAASA